MSATISKQLLQGAAPKARRAVAVVCASTQQPGAKVEQWLKTPFDVAAFGPRAALGALVSLPERVQMMQDDITKIVELVQSPRPVDEKGALALQEAEDALVECLARGAGVETDALAALKAALPQELAAALDAVVPPLPDVASGSGVGSGSSSGYGASTSGSTSSSSSGSTYGVVADAPPPAVFTAAAVADSQVAAEVAEIRAAVAGVKAALEELRANADASRGGMLRLNLREARDMLARRLREATLPAAASGGGAGSGSAGSGSSGSDGAAGSLAAARREAQVLLDEVDGQFFSPSS